MDFVRTKTRRHRPGTLPGYYTVTTAMARSPSEHVLVVELLALFPPPCCFRLDVQVGRLEDVGGGYIRRRAD